MTLGTPAAPTLETPRLILRGWRPGDFAPYAAMLADAETARFITAAGRALSEEEAWNETVWLIGHWQLLGYGMFVVEERGTGAFLGRVGPLRPPRWPGFEIAWSLAPGAAAKAMRRRRRERRSAGPSPPFRWTASSPPSTRATMPAAKLPNGSASGGPASSSRPPRSCDVWEMRREDWSASDAEAARWN